MFNPISLDAADQRRLLPVRSEREIEFFVKESEILTGRPGRDFVIVGAERLSYRVEWHGAGLSVRRFDGNAPVAPTLFVQRQALMNHTLGNAMRYGQLFTPHLH